MPDTFFNVVLHLLRLLNLPISIPNNEPNMASLLATVTSSLAHHSFVEDLSQHPNPPVGSLPEVYDFIVVGGGTAGSVVGNRLSANSKYTVLVLEAGGDPSVLNSIPGLAPFNMHHPHTDWMYTTVPTKGFGLAVQNQRGRFSRFKGLGGCSTHNWMVYMRGHPKDYDLWAQLTGDEDWNYRKVLKYFKKLENYAGKYPNDTYHGTEGPFYISTDSGFTPSLVPWNAAAIELGYDTKTDFNSVQKPSFGRPDVLIDLDGKRVDSYTAYIKPILKRPNLKIYRYAHVHKVLVDSGNKAYGVIYKRHGELIQVNVTKEIILSGGAINTPKLLLLSGIGPEEHLTSVGIPTVVDLAGVGSKMEDHTLNFVGPFLLNSSISYLPNRDMKLEDAQEYVANGTGFFATNGVNAVGLISSTRNPNKTWPDLQLFQFSLGVDPVTPTIMNILMTLRPGLVEQWLEPYMGTDANFVFLDVGRPQSAGSVRLVSNRPEDHPLIYPNYFENPNDLKAQIDGMNFVVNTFESGAWGRHGARLAPTPLPGCGNVLFKSEAYYECLIRQTTTSLFHPSGTCKMGRVDDGMTVVDSRLRVVKVSQLRIADASVMPKIPNGNINTATLMIGEKAADLILSDHGIQTKT